MGRWVLVAVCGALLGCGSSSSTDGGAGGSGGAGGGGGGGAGGDDPCNAPDCVVRLRNGEAHALAYDSQQRPVVAYSGGADLNLYGVRRLEGGVWRPLGDTLEGLAWAAVGPPRLLIDAQDRPVLAYGLSVGNSLRVRVVRYGGSSWESLGEFEAGFLAGLQRVGDTLYVAATALGTQRVFVWTSGTTWTPTTLTAAGSFANSPAVGLFGGKPHLAYRDVSTGAFQVFSFDTAFTAVGGPFPADNRTRVAGLVELGGQLVLNADVSSADGGTTRELRPTRQTGATWEVLPTPSPVRGQPGQLAVVGGALVAAFPVRAAGASIDDPLVVSKWTGAAWSQVDSFLTDNTGLAGRPEVAVLGGSLGLIWDSPGGNPGFRINYRVVPIP